jgi:tRNA pseudouridine32 synthase / 23S rRNA pseudouridine746 synthase
MPAESLLNILHEDPDFIVVDKPGGMLSIPGKGPEKEDSVAFRVRTLYPDCIKNPTVHRLDMDTSGLMVVALNAASQRHLSIQFQEREVGKKYIALLDGHLEADRGTIELAFRVDTDNRPFQMYDAVNGKLGITDWEKIGVENGYTRVAFRPKTGRTHQLRVHAAHERGLGTPIVGDPFYGTATDPVKMMLHASELSFRHPATEDPLAFKSTPPF